MLYREVLEASRGKMGPFCKSCPICNGVACRNQMPGPGAKGSGEGAIRNYQKWQEIRVCLDTITQKKPVHTEIELFGKNFAYPIFAGPVGSVKMHYGDLFSDQDYNELLVRGCADNKIAAFTGDGADATVMEAATVAIKKIGGMAIPTIKPWNLEVIQKNIKLAEDAGAFAIAMDIDAAGLPFLKNMVPPAGSKSVEELTEIISLTDRPFIIKGIMTVRGALKALEAGAAGIVVSNHGGRVLDNCQATAEVLREIAVAVDGKMKIIVDGGIRSGADVFKAIALGADAVLIARPFVNAIYGDGIDGIKAYLTKITEELKDTMSMCGAYKISEIKFEMIKQ